jgi:hypothetical protein
VIRREIVQLTALAKRGMSTVVEVRGIRIHLLGGKLEGSDIDYARFEPDISEFPRRVKAMLDEKGLKLRRYKDQGFGTWIVAYNTLWPLFSPVDVQQIVRPLLSADHAHVDHVGICDDAWVIVVR